MAKNDRFQVIHKEGNGHSSPQIMVLMDSVTGVQYLFTQWGYAGGLCPWVEKVGGPLTWEV